MNADDTDLQPQMVLLNFLDLCKSVLSVVRFSCAEPPGHGFAWIAVSTTAPFAVYDSLAPRRAIPRRAKRCGPWSRNRDTSRFVIPSGARVERSDASVQSRDLCISFRLTPDTIPRKDLFRQDSCSRSNGLS